MSEEDTQPNPAARTPRNYLRRAWAWCVENPHYSLPLVAFVAGVVVGKLL